MSGRASLARAATAASALGVAACTGTTGSDLFEFEAFAAGPEDAVAGEPYTFRTGRGFTVTLEEATVHVGAVYLNRSVPASVSEDTTCVLAGTYVAEVTTGRDVDVLSGTLEPFPLPGRAIEATARTAEVWLVHGDVDAEDEERPVLTVRGTAADDGGTVLSFEGRITIGENRVEPSGDPALPGARPICKQRIVTPIPTDARVRRGGRLELRVDPRGFFANVDFTTLPEPAAAGAPRVFTDGPGDQASTNLYGGVRSSFGTYTPTWRNVP